MKIHEIRTQHTPEEVIERARRFFALAGSPYAAFSEEGGDRYLKLFMEVGEIVIGCIPEGGVTLVRGSASRGEHVLTKFLTTLAPPLEARQELHRYTVRRVHGARIGVGVGQRAVQLPSS